MFTVLIYQKSSQAFIDQYRSLFEPYEEKNQIAFCFWDQHGTDLSTALPELAGIIRGVRVWQAIVVMPRFENDVEEHLTRNDNPFDYLCNSDSEPEIKESDIPLIRLSQMLGGVPLVNQHFSFKMSDTIKKEPQLNVERLESREYLLEQQEKWQELNDKYSFTCDKPTRLILFKAKNTCDIKLPTTTDQDIFKRHESDSSMFWYRNRYPAKARFLTQECTSFKNAHYYEDLFSFWMTALTIALSEFPTGTFEAYKLYNAVSMVDTDLVQQLFSDYYNRLAAVQFSANRHISELQKNVHMQREQDELPFYQCKIPVEVSLKEDKDIYPKEKNVGLTTDCPSDEKTWWYTKAAQSIKKVKKLFITVRMALDRSSVKCRYSSTLTDEEIIELDEYQFEEVNEQLSDLETKILTFNTYAALPIRKYTKELEKQKTKTGEEMKKRMTKKNAIISALVVVAVYFLSYLPNYIYAYKYRPYSYSAYQMALIGCGLLIILAIAALFYFRYQVVAKIKLFNSMIHMIISNLQDVSVSFSDYLSDCCTYMRGRYLTQTLERRTTISSEEIKMLGIHVEHLENQMNIIEGWLSDFDMSVLLDDKNHNRDYFNFDIPPEKNRGYSIEMDDGITEVPSVGGSKCKAPYSYITEFKVNRVSIFEVEKELFEDDERGKE